jgi:hypothetical protein
VAIAISPIRCIAASVRFHRPPSGLGHTDLAMSHIKSMRLLTDAMNTFTC